MCWAGNWKVNFDKGLFVRIATHGESKVESIIKVKPVARMT